MKRVLTMTCAVAMALSLAACSTANGTDNSLTSDTVQESVNSALASNTAYAGTTVVGQITAINDTGVTLRLGELSVPNDSNQNHQTPPDQNDSQNQSGDNQAPPEKPEGEEPDGNGSQNQSGDSQTPPEKPEGEMPQGEAPNGNGSDSQSEDNQTPPEMPGGGSFGGSGEVTQGASANTITEDGTYENQTYESTGDDENALRVDGAEVTLNNITVNKSAGATSNTENGDFYGVNAALLATDGANVTIQNATVTSSAQNGNGVFSYGSGTVVNIADSTITATADNSGGIQTTGGGTTNASNLTVETSGNSSAAIRSDRGGGTVNVNGGTYTSNGYNSPAVYSTAAITVSDATLTANNSEALVIEGKNSITLDNCTVYGNMSDTKGTSSDENVHNVMIYQSMSGDADVGTSIFSMTGGIPYLQQWRSVLHYQYGL